MSATIWIAIVALYMNGTLADIDLIGHSENQADCVKALPNVIEMVRKDLPPTIQIEAKCMNYSDAARGVSAFGSKAK